MTEAEELKRRRELVILSAELQRATIVRRLDRMEANPARRYVGYAAKVVRNPMAMSIGAAMLRLAVRKLRSLRAPRTPPPPPRVAY